MNKKRVQRGFTLIELLLVLVILAILAAVVVPKFVNRGQEARITAAKTDISNISSALDTYEVDAGHYPTGQQGLSALVTNPGDAIAWHGPYVKTVPNDPWGHPYVYQYPGTHNTNGYDLFSTGPGGTDASGNDINNWSQK